MNRDIRHIAVIGAGAAGLIAAHVQGMIVEDKHGNRCEVEVVSDEEVRVLVTDDMHPRFDLSPIEIFDIKRRVIFEKNDKIHWHDRQRNFRGRQHQRLIFQRTTNK